MLRALVWRAAELASPWLACCLVSETRRQPLPPSHPHLVTAVASPKPSAVVLAAAAGSNRVLQEQSTSCRADWECARARSVFLMANSRAQTHGGSRVLGDELFTFQNFHERKTHETFFCEACMGSKLGSL